MTSLRLSTVALMWSIVLWGTLLGAITYSHIVYFPVYLSALPDSAVVVTGPYGLNEATFWILIHPLLILSLLVTLALNWKVKPRRKLIGLTAAIYAAVIVVSALYFIPELGAFHESAQSTATAAEWLARGQRWQHLSWVRGAVCYAACVPLLMALTVPAAAQPARGSRP